MALVSYSHSRCFTKDRESYTLSDYKFRYESFWKEYHRYSSSKPVLGELRLKLRRDCQQDSSLNDDFGGFYVWIAQLSLKNRRCSGAWITERFVLTTESCAGDIRLASMASTTTELSQVIQKGISAVYKLETQNTQNVALVKLSSTYTPPEYRPLCLASNETRTNCVVLGVGNNGIQKQYLDVVPLDSKVCTYVARLQNIASDERSTCFRISTLKNFNHWNSEAGSPVVCSLVGPGPPQVEGVLQTRLQMSDGEMPFVVTRVVTFNEWIVEKISHQ